MIGQTLGPYTIVSKLGEGGMGEVYRARDTKLNRDVAIKVLLPAVASDADRLARFSREAQVLASLNHPNIASIYGLEDGAHSTGSGQAGVRALVMELVEGPTLADQIARGPIPLDEALPIARQIAEALEAAHDHGIIHRDLKPANIKVRADGTVKVLDFGLAKAIDPTAGSSATAMNSPTLSIHATEAGIILGTAAYMSPEQARGKAVDRRADIWALGCVLFEMLTGARPFQGGDPTDTIIAVVTKEPNWSALPASVPSGVRTLLRRSLEKDPKRRLDSAAGVRIEIDEALNPSNLTNLTNPTNLSNPSPWLRALPWAIVAILAATGIVLWFGLGRNGTTSEVSRISRFVVQPPVGTRMGGRAELSPDGSQIVYTGTEGGRSRLFLRPIDQFEATPIAGTDGASYPFFSPDGQWLAFIVGNQLRKINLAALSAPIVLGTVNTPMGFNWPTDDTIMYAQFQHGLSSLSAEGGQPRSVTERDGKTEVDHHNPMLLPGGEAVLFTSHHGKEQFRVVSQLLATGERKVLIESAFDARYSTTGHLVYGSQRAILAVPFDLSRLEITGAPVVLVDHVANDPLTGTGNFRLSVNGSLVYQPEQPMSGRTLTWVDRSGVETPIPIPPRGFTAPKVSPDGKRLVFAALNGDRQDIWTYEMAADRLSRVTLDGTHHAPIWTADGRRLTYVSIQAGVQQLFRQAFDGSGTAESLVSSPNTLAPGAWTADDRTLVYIESPPNGLTDVLVLRPDGEGRPQPVLKRAATARNRTPSLSPDGRWLAYMSDETGRYEIYVEAFPASGSRHLVTAEGGDSPAWRRDGRELFYRRGAAMFAVSVNTTGEFATGKPVRLFEGRYVASVASMAGTVDYDAAPDGRFLMVKPSAEELASPHLNVVLNWANELTRRVPTGKSR